MKILITNNALANRSGSELYVQEIALELISRGHTVAAFSTDLGQLSERMIEQGVTVVDDLTQLTWVPDIIHAQHHLETMIALAYFPHTPAIYVCHGWRPWQESPPLHPRIMTYAAVDVKTRDHAIKEYHVPSNNICIIHNFVDLNRFKVRPHLPSKPKKALVFSNYANDDNFLPYIQKACDKADILLDVVGASSGHAVEKPEDVIGAYDLIFAVGRSSLEALASGVSVVICGVWGVGPLVTFKDVERLRDLNFGSATMYAELDTEIIYKVICHYDADDAMRVTQYLRERIGLDQAVEKLEKLYIHVVETYDPTKVNIKEDSHAYAKYLKNIAILLKKTMYDYSAMYEDVQKKEIMIQQKDQEILKKNQELQQKNTEIAIMRSSKFWKLREWHFKVKFVVYSPIKFVKKILKK